MTKEFPACSITKPADGFGRNAALPDGLSFYCLERNRRRSNENYRKRRAAEGIGVRTPDSSPEGFKRCAQCQASKPTGDFHKTARTLDGLVVYCKPCRALRGRAMHLKRSYGLDEAQLAEMIVGQGGVCAICKKRPPVHVDHDHDAGTVRGVLCFRCNVALGQLGDDVQSFRNAIDYLERTDESQWQRTLVSTGVYQLTSPRRGAAASGTSSELQRLICSRRG